MIDGKEEQSEKRRKSERGGGGGKDRREYMTGRVLCTINFAEGSKKAKNVMLISKPLRKTRKN
jgi:hypothetical protein